MIIYVDLIFIINLIFDFALLLTVDMLLKRNIKYRRIFLGAITGELSMITLFVNFSSLENFIFKIALTFIMCLTAFGFKSFKYTFYNVIYLYLVGIILGGFLYFLYQEFNINKEYSIKYLIILFLSPLTLYIYYKLTTKFKNNYNNRYRITFDYDTNHFEGVGYLDSGNKLISPLTGKPIILVEKEYIKNHKLKLLPVPFNALNHQGLVFCFKPEKLSINGKFFEGALIGISEVKFNIEGCNALLNARMENI